MQFCLGLADVGAAPEQFRRHADRHARRHRGDRLRLLQLGAQGIGRLPEQQAECVDEVGLILLDRRYLGGRVADLCGGVRHVEIGGQPAGRALLRQLQRVLRGLQVVLGDLLAKLRAAQIDVVAGHLGQRRQQRVALCLLRGVDRGIGRFHRPPDLAPQIKLPGRVEAVLIEVEGYQVGADDAAGPGAAAGAAGLGARRRAGRRTAEQAEYAVVAGLLALVAGVAVQVGKLRELVPLKLHRERKERYEAFSCFSRRIHSVWRVCGNVPLGHALSGPPRLPDPGAFSDPTA